MSDTVIKVDNLSKQYRIGAREGYKTFRETLVDAAKAPFQQISSLLNPKSKIRNPKHETIWALKDVSFEVKQGEVLGIIGRNGAGKSTLLKVLSKITEPTEGRVELRGRVGSLLEVGTGFHPELTGHENIYLYGAILGMDRWEVSRKFDEIVAFGELEKFIDTPVKRYSSGMYMRLAFAVAAHMEPEILLVDEVLAVGDAEFQKKCLGKIGDVAGGGRTVLFVSHNMGAIGTLCQRGMVISEGQIAFDGHALHAIERYFDQLKSFADLELSQRQDRKGSGTCRFTRMSLVDENNRNLEVIRSGQTLRIVLDYESDRKENLHSVKAGISVHHSMFGQIMYCDNITAGQLMKPIPSNGRLTCTVTRLPLTPGLYSISVFLKTGRELLDFIEDAATFQIEEGDFFGTGKLPPKGILLLDNYSWNTA